MKQDNFIVITDMKEIQTQFASCSPFNIVNDTKGINKQEIIEIAQEIADLLKQGQYKRCVIYRHNKNTYACIVKLRCKDNIRKKGKSNGYRCIVLVDEKRYLGIPLHIYRHGHGEDKNISQSDKNKLKSLVQEYIES